MPSMDQPTTGTLDYSLMAGPLPEKQASLYINIESIYVIHPFAYWENWKIIGVTAITGGKEPCRTCDTAKTPVCIIPHLPSLFLEILIRVFHCCCCLENLDRLPAISWHICFCSLNACKLWQVWPVQWWNGLHCQIAFFLLRFGLSERLSFQFSKSVHQNLMSATWLHTLTSSPHYLWLYGRSESVWTTLEDTILMNDFWKLSYFIDHGHNRSSNMRAGWDIFYSNTNWNDLFSVFM